MLFSVTTHLQDALTLGKPFFSSRRHFWGASFPISHSQTWDCCPNPFPLWGMCSALLHTEGKKIIGCKALCRHTRTQNPAPFYAKISQSVPGLSRAPAALCGVLASSSKSSKTKPNQVPDFFNPGAGRGRFVFPQQRRSPVFQLGKILGHATASINFPVPAAIGERFFWEKLSHKPTFQSRREKKAA